MNFTAKNPKYATRDKRLSTFSSWPKQIKQTPGGLTEAGFFYKGKSDSVCCFSCDGELKDWSPDDDPWEEHARWYPQCAFLRQCKGDDFIAAFRCSASSADDVERTEELERTNVWTDSLSGNVAAMTLLEWDVESSLVRRAVDIAEDGGSVYSAQDLLEIVDSLDTDDNEKAAGPVHKDTYTVQREETQYHASCSKTTPLEETGSGSSVLSQHSGAQPQTIPNQHEHGLLGAEAATEDGDLKMKLLQSVAAQSVISFGEDEDKVLKAVYVLSQQKGKHRERAMNIDDITAEEVLCMVID